MTPEEILKTDFLYELMDLLKYYGFQPTDKTVEFFNNKEQIKVVYERSE